MTNQFSRRQVLKLGVAAPAVLALSAVNIPAAAASTVHRASMANMLLPGVPSRKKGVSLVVPKTPFTNPTPSLPYADRVLSLNPAWYYTWGPAGISGVQHVEFVPMVWGGENNVQAQIAAVKALGPGKVPIVLGPNEPDNVGQSNMTVDEVIAVWPEISKLAALTVAPAPVHPFPPSGIWLPQFVAAAKELHYHFNYIAVHAYPGNDPAGFLAEIDQTYEMYGLPIWITEFAVADWQASKTSPNIYTPDDVVGFMEAVLPALEARPHVARYAWFGAGPAAATSLPLGPSALFDVHGDMTTPGTYYAQFQATIANPVQAGGAESR